VALGLLGRELAAANELGHQRVVLRELLEPLVADQVRPRVADVADRDPAVFHERDRHRRAHPGGGRILRLALVDPPVGLLDQLVDPLLPAFPVQGVVPECRGSKARGELTGLRAAHPVGDREQGRLADIGVFVVTAPAAGIGDAGDPSEPRAHDSYLSSVSPIRRTSPGASRFARVT
jgi:hypothetical protein